MERNGPSGSPQILVRGCRFPAGLLYDVANHMWYAPLAGGNIRLGMTEVGAALADYRIFAVNPKRVGNELENGRACATIESSKWVGPARIAFDGVVAEVNAGLIDRPGLLAEDPYGAGWMMVATPADANALAGLVTGETIAAAYGDWMDRANFPGCGREEGR